MKKKLLALIPVVLLLLPLLFIRIPWYSNIIPGELDVESAVKDLAGWEVLLSGRGRILISLIFCILLQGACVKGKSFIFAIIGNILLIVELTLYTEINYYPIEYAKLFFLNTFSLGYYLVLACLLICIIINIVQIFNVKKNWNPATDKKLWGKITP